MWLRHFRKKRATVTFRRFRERYLMYVSEDCSEVCKWHHEEVHRRYLRIIRSAISAKDYKPLEQWSWREAEELMQRLRAYCDQWLKRETPGVKPRRIR